MSLTPEGVFKIIDRWLEGIRHKTATGIALDMLASGTQRSGGKAAGGVSADLLFMCDVACVLARLSDDEYDQVMLYHSIRCARAQCEADCHMHAARRYEREQQKVRQRQAYKTGMTKLQEGFSLIDRAA